MSRIVAYRLIVDECPGSLSRAVTEAAGKGWVPHEVASWHPRVGWWQAVVRHEERAGKLESAEERHQQNLRQLVRELRCLTESDEERAGKRERMVYPVAERGVLSSLADLEPAVI